MQLHLLRHGQTPASRENRFSGASDPPLTDTGRLMAESFGRAYAATPWAAIYTSPMTRARDTAAPLCRALGIEPVIDDALREISHGEWEGLTNAEAEARDPAAYAYWKADVAGRGAPGGEAAFAVAARAVAAVDRIKTRHPDGNVLVVSHKATIRIITCALLGLDVRLYRDRIAQPTGSLTVFQLRASGPLLRRLADVAHLPPEIRDTEGT